MTLFFERDAYFLEREAYKSAPWHIRWRAVLEINYFAYRILPWRLVPWRRCLQPCLRAIIQALWAAGFIETEGSEYPTNWRTCWRLRWWKVWERRYRRESNRAYEHGKYMASREIGDEYQALLRKTFGR